MWFPSNIINYKTKPNKKMKKIFVALLLVMFFVPLKSEARKKAKKDDVPQMANYPSAVMSEYRMHGGEVVIKGRVIAPDQKTIEQMNGRISAIVRDYVVRDEKTTLFDVKSDGTFKLNVYVPYPMYMLVYPVAEVYACPGDTIDVTFDTTKRAFEEMGSVDGTGVSGEVSRRMSSIRERYCKFPEYKDVYEQVFDSLLRWRDGQVAYLDELVRQMNAGLPELEGCSPLATDILKTYILKSRFYGICHCYYNYSSVADSKQENQDECWLKYFDFVSAREKYLLDNPLLMIGSDEFFFNRMEFTLMRPFHSCSQALIYRIDYVPDVAESVEGQMSKRERNRRVIEELKDKLNLNPTNFSTQVCLLREFFSTIKWHGDSYDSACEDLASYLPFISHPELLRRALWTYREYVKENELQIVEGKPLTKGDSIFQRIIEPYKGNILYIDFWEMSCGPCRGLMLGMRDKVEEFKDYPVKFLYITDDSEDKCREFLESNNIKGEHIFISRSEWGYLQEKFQFTGIPFCIAVDKEGNQIKNFSLENVLKNDY